MAEINLPNLESLKYETNRLRQHMNSRIGATPGTTRNPDAPATVAEVTELSILLDQVLNMLAPTSDNARLTAIENNIAELNRHQHQYYVSTLKGKQLVKTTRPVGFGSKR
jgi:hypothetical protein